MELTKQDALKAIQDDKAKFIEEAHIAKDCWELTYEFNGYRIFVGAFGYDRWLDDDANNVRIEKIS
jgi:hypothetical protein